MVRRLTPWLPVLVLALALFWASAQANLRFAQGETEDFLIRKTGHIVVYAVGTLLLWRALALTTRLRPAWAWAAAVTLAFAVSDELHQIGVLGREPSIEDVAIDAIGIAAALAIGRVVVQKRSPR